MACPCNQGCLTFCTCCFNIFGCPNSSTSGLIYLISGSPTTGAAFLTANVGNTIHLTGIGTIQDGCYIIGTAIDTCIDLTACNGTIIVPNSVLLASPLFTVCTKCSGLKATDCDNNSNIVFFNGPAATSLIIGKVIKTAFPGFSERCWLITQTIGNPTTSLSTYQGPYNDCPECQGGGCVDLLSSISGRDDTCDRGIGSATVTPTTGVAPFTYLWSNGQTTQTAVGLTTGNYTVTFTDANGCTGTNSVVINNLPCNSYLITPCGGTPFVVTNPITFPDPNPDNYVGNIFLGTISGTGSEVPEGCYNMITSSLQGVQGVVINVTTYSFNTCLECAPTAWKVARCDDPNVFYFTNSDLSLVENKVIKNVTFTGCDDTTFPCNSLPEQCWLVTPVPPGLVPVIVTYDSLIYPDCDCCKPC